MNFDQLKYFVETVQCQSINKAAQNLYINQSTLTVALKSIETELGCQLLLRSHTGVKATAEGERVYFDAVKILEVYQEWQQLSQITKKKQNIVTIFCLESLANTLFRDISLKISLDYAPIGLDVQIRTPNEMLTDETNTIFINSIYTGHKKDILKNTKKHTWNTEILFEDQLCVYVNDTHPLYQQTSVSLKVLQQQKLVFSAQPETASVPLINMLNIYNAYRISTPQNMLKLAAENNLCTILPNLLANYPQYISLYGLKPIPIDDFDSRIYFYLAYPPEIHLTPEQKQMVVIIKELCQQFTQNNVDLNKKTK